MSKELSKVLKRREVLKLLGASTIAASLPLPIVAAKETEEGPGHRAVPARERLFAYRSFWPEFGAMKQFQEAGVDTYCIFAAHTNNSLGLPYSQYPPVWRWFDKYDFDSLNRQFDDVLNINPNAAFICMIDLNSPDWLHRQLLHRNYEKVESYSMLSSACATPAWIKATLAYLEATIKHMEARYGDRIKAYQLACGATDEWLDMQQGSAGRAKTKAWKAWLKKHGKEDVPIPSFQRLDQASFDDLVRDPATEKDVVDYAHFTGDLIADAALVFAGRTRELIPKQRQIGMFFGYIMELARKRLVWAGHLEYERLFSSPSIDYFAGPGTYTDRKMGGGSGFMVPNGTITMNGKAFLQEIDHRTPTYNRKLDDFVTINYIEQWKNQPATNAGLKREFSLAIINNASLWCFDMFGGVFKTSESMNVIAQSKKLWAQYTSTLFKSRAEVALVVDPQSARYINDSNPQISHIYQGTRNKLNRLGAPYEVFSFNDLPKVDLTSYKLIIFPGLFQVTSEKMAILKKHVFNKDRTVFFVYAPGICNEDSLDTDRVKALTGTAFNTPGISKVQRDTWVSVYAPDYETVTPQVLKQVATEAGVTVYCPDEIPVYANERLVAIHMKKGGEKTITLPGAVHQVKELYTGKVIPVVNQTFSYHFSSPDTVLFETT
ncbi:MAG: hypothetical protein L3K26_12355 [Candidatus Hydrogenedentes bacterium]|nr:hypothetical protein [Candidatus Hydrogenedentota bacterium]